MLPRKQQFLPSDKSQATTVSALSTLVSISGFKKVPKCGLLMYCVKFRIHGHKNFTWLMAMVDSIIIIIIIIQIFIT